MGWACPTTTPPESSVRSGSLLEKECRELHRCDLNAAVAKHFGGSGPSDIIIDADIIVDIIPLWPASKTS